MAFLRDSDVNYLAFIMMGPFIIATILCMLNGIQFLFKYCCHSRSKETSPLLRPKTNIWHEYKLQCVSIFLYTTYFLYNGLSATILQNMSCKSVINNVYFVLIFQDEFSTTKFIVTKPWQSCEVTGDYAILLSLSLIFLFLYILGIPGMFAILLYKNKQSISSPETKSLLGFFYLNYNPKYFYLEILWLLRNFAIAASYTFFQEDKPVQGKESVYFY